MDREAGKDHLSNIFTIFSKHEDFTLVLMNSAYDIDEVIEQCFFNQNVTLTGFSSNQVDNLFGINAVIVESSSGEKTSIREIFATS